jgi:hypothetical protein
MFPYTLDHALQHSNNDFLAGLEMGRPAQPGPARPDPAQQIFLSGRAGLVE